LLAAIIYEFGFRIDDFMVAIADALQAEGIRTRGVVQHNFGSASCPQMALVDLATGRRFAISQNLGPQARGCRLDTDGLSIVSALFDATIREDFDLLILNKFGKAEAEGGGLRNAFAGAMDAGIPVLTAVRPPYVEAWSKFHGGLAVDLEPRAAAVLGWCRTIIGKRRDADGLTAHPAPAESA